MRGTSPDPSKTSPNPSKGGECQKDKDLQSKLIVYWLISFLNHYPICLSPPLEGSGEVTSLICKQFSIYTVSTHGLLASQRRPLGLQKVPFWSLINALLESN